MPVKNWEDNKKTKTKRISVFFIKHDVRLQLFNVSSTHKRDRQQKKKQQQRKVLDEGKYENPFHFDWTSFRTHLSTNVMPTWENPVGDVPYRKTEKKTKRIKKDHSNKRVHHQQQQTITIKQIFGWYMYILYGPIFRIKYYNNECFIQFTFINTNDVQKKTRRGLQVYYDDLLLFPHILMDDQHPNNKRMKKGE